MTNNGIKITDISTDRDQLVKLSASDLVKLPAPYDTWEEKEFVELTEARKERIEHSLDGVAVIGISKPENDEEKERKVAQFLQGLHKLLTKENNWTFLKPLLLSLENCVKCQTCADECPVYIMSGKVEAYRPTFRSEVLRRIIQKYIKPSGKVFPKFVGAGIEMNWNTIARLAELSYRCTLCRRCAQACPIGVDNGLLTREIRKLFSQELGFHPMELHTGGTVKQLKTGSSTGMNPTALSDIIEFAEEDILDNSRLDLQIPFDKEGADVLIMHNAGEFLSWPENLQAFAIVLDAAGLSWTMSSELMGYDSVNYGLFYDDVMYARLALKHAEVAKKLKVRKIVMGECGHAHKAFMAIGDRIFLGDNNIPRESALVLLEDLVVNDKIMLDPSRNDFPVTLHDPCNITRAMGIVKPQRNILKKICPQFREMEPHGVRNFCCGGGSGFAIMGGDNIKDWRTRISSRMKFRQILEAFSDNMSPEIPKYGCAPCSNCKGQIRDTLAYYEATKRVNIHYGGLVELIVNAMVDIEEPFIRFDGEM